MRWARRGTEIRGTRATRHSPASLLSAPVGQSTRECRDTSQPRRAGLVGAGEGTGTLPRRLSWTAPFPGAAGGPTPGGSITLQFSGGHGGRALYSHALGRTRNAAPPGSGGGTAVNGLKKGLRTAMGRRQVWVRVQTAPPCGSGACVMCAHARRNARVLVKARAGPRPRAGWRAGACSGARRSASPGHERRAGLLGMSTAARGEAPPRDVRGWRGRAQCPPGPLGHCAARWPVWPHCGRGGLWAGGEVMTCARCGLCWPMISVGRRFGLGP
jgi:hypothetical protein